MFLREAQKNQDEFPTDNATVSALSEDEKIIFCQLTAEPCYIDDLIAQVQVPRNRVAQAVLNLELKGMIRQLPGKMYLRKE